MLNRWLFNTNKLKTNCKLGISRIKLLRNKKQIALKNFRREVADLLRAGKHGNARIRVESVIRETLLLQSFDTLEVYLELLAVRAELLSKTEDMPADMVEAVASIVYAAHRMSSDLPELAVLRTLLAGKYERVYKGWAAAAASDTHYREWQVNEGLVSCLSVEAPGPEQKIAVLKSICEEFEIPFDEDAVRMDMGAPRVAPPPPPGAGGPGRGPPRAMQPSWGAAHFEEALDAPGPSQGAAPGPADQGGWKPAPIVAPAEQNGARPGDDEANDIPARDSRDLAAAAERSAARLRGAANGAAAGGSAQAPPVGTSQGKKVTSVDAPSPAAPPRFVNRSESEIKRAYDAAPGYPTKSTQPQPPSAPPSSELGSPASAAPSEPDGAATRPGGPPPSPPEETEELSELEELTKRFEALKRQ
ncbi:hypothetical protein QBZ16_000641 [Prototheca wickerhamii]|uniref:IST1-like protein n=1 Tax=Prototheca wickerhamii TaxID=3111 RepID=A0AAD9IQ30_PROWI|nr:hypothetical protein QBZ16_000641 [Prototheca wickerhamii]